MPLRFTHRFRLLLAGFLCIAPTVFPAWAAAPPPSGSFTDPGALQREERRQMERERLLQELEAPPPEVVIEGLREEDGYRLPDAGPTFFLQGIRFSRTEMLEEETLREITGRYVGRDVDFAELNRLIDEIDALYDARGAVTARALIPPQEIKDGIVHVLLVEGRLGELTIGALRYTRPEFLTGRLTLPERGEVLDLLALQNELSRFNSLYELNLLAGLQPGKEFGETDVLIVPRERPRWMVAGFADNAGTETTGRERVGVTGTWRGLRGTDDRLFAYLSGARSSLSGSAGYNLPVNRRGGRLEASVSANDIEVTRGAFRDLDIEGRSYVGNLGYRHPVLRKGGWAIDGTGHTSWTDSRTDYLGGLRLSRHVLLKGGFGARVAHIGDRHQVSFTQNVSYVDADERLSDTRERYLLWDGSAMWTQRYRLPVYTVLSANWQLSADRELPSADLYQAGGLYSVRGYEQNVITGARGYAVSFELHWPVSERWTPYLFADHGGIQAVSPRSEEIGGAGAGLNWRWNRRLSGQLDLARALTHIEPDQDRTQIHFRINLAFEGG